MNNAFYADGITLYAKQDEIVSVHGHLNTRRNVFSFRESGGNLCYALALCFEFTMNESALLGLSRAM